MKINIGSQTIILQDTKDEMVNWLALELESTAQKMEGAKNMDDQIIPNLFVGMSLAYLQTLCHILGKKGIPYEIIDKK